MSKPLFMSQAHVDEMNAILQEAFTVTEACRALDRSYALHYDLSDGPGGQQIHWSMVFDPTTGVRMGLDAKDADLTFVGDWTDAIRASAAQRLGNSYNPGFLVEGDVGILDTVSAAYDEAQRLAAVEVTFPDVLCASRIKSDFPEYDVVEDHLHNLHRPAFGRPHALRELHASTDGASVAVTGSVFDELVGVPRTAVYTCDDGKLNQVTTSCGSARWPRFAPDGSLMSFLSDRADRGVFQLCLLPTGRFGEATATTVVPGTVEYSHWSPDGRQVLLGVAGLGADLSGAQGSGTSVGPSASRLADWEPLVEAGEQDGSWRSLWIYSVETDTATRVSPDGLNCWEATWCGNGQVATVASDDPSEDAWYDATLRLIDTQRGTVEELFRSKSQLAMPTCSPDATHIAIVQAICSDRGVVAGDLAIIDRSTGIVETQDTLGVDVASLQWVRPSLLGYIGQRHLDSVAGTIDTVSGEVQEILVTDRSCGGVSMYPDGAFVSDETVITIQEAYDLPQQVVVTGRTTTVLASTAHSGTDYLSSVAGTASPISWMAPDGLEIEGILCTPQGDGPFPLVVNIHGGPVWAYRNTWSMTYAWVPLLVSLGYAVLNPNPRGSGGRGQQFARRVVGDMGGADTYDYLSGIDRLVHTGIADAERVGLIGGSYGGFMSSWLVTQDERFAAAVPISPVTDWYSQSFTSNVAGWGNAFLDADDPEQPGSQTHARSPVLQTSKVRTPCLNVAGAKDRCTPPSQAREFHQALRSHGVESTLVIYPQEGHGVRAYPAMTDFLARVVRWFDTYMPVDVQTAPNQEA